MHDAFAVEIHETGGELSHPKAYYVLGKVTLAIEVIYHDVLSTLRHATRDGDGSLHRRSPPHMRSRTKKQFSSF